MRTSTTPAGRPGEDRLERLLAGRDDEPARSEDVPSQDQLGDSTDAWEDHLDGRPVRGRHRLAGVPLLSVPESLRSSELTVGARAVRGLLVLVVAACLVLGGRWLWTEHVAVATPPERVLPSGVDGDLDGTPGKGASAGDRAGAEVSPAEAEADERSDTAKGDAGAGTSAATREEAAGADDLVVHVTGAVAEPGVVTVPAGSRVVDAVRAVGGVTKEADQSTLNLARPLVDGEQVWVGRPGETPPVAPGPLPRAGGDPGDARSGGVSSAPLDLNVATQADLEELPGVGPVTAGHILTWREEHGRFSSVEELLEVSGIGERTLAQLEPLVSVGG